MTKYCSVKGLIAFAGAISLLSCVNHRFPSNVHAEEEAIVPVFSTDISTFVTEVDIYPIDTTVIFSSVTKMVADEKGNLFMLDSRGMIHSLSPDGRRGPLTLRRGRASNEYTSVMDISYSDGRISILEDSRIKVFDVQNTQNSLQIELSQVKDPVDAIASIPGGKFYLFSAYSASTQNDKKEQGDMVRLIDSGGRLISESVPRNDCTFSMNNISQSRNHYYLRPQNSESVFLRLDEETMAPAFKVNFGEKAMPERYYYDVAGEDIGAYMMSDYYKLPMDYHDTKDYVYCRFCGSQAAECAMVYSRKNSKSIAWENTRDDSNFRILGSDDDSFILISVNQDGELGPLGRIIQPLLAEKCQIGQGAIVRIKFCF